MAAVRTAGNALAYIASAVVWMIALTAEVFTRRKIRRHTAALAYQTAITECRCHCCEGTGLLG
ncbi:hypothetical protein HOV03_gp96 [Gordonia phage Asapag]|uniref:Uncharacterized protein n=1 Tax=Gordonia phage Asapag TaxID=2507862 RepID=A0A410TDX8_9CAUD|nr:hypothetical protein HOV03_gp96 [Gordonia phage Asapag]QAU07235.1 hypothetical protein SEA_ASAPAG_96 [Gordonia phage Asapag]